MKTSSRKCFCFFVFVFKGWEGLEDVSVKGKRSVMMTIIDIVGACSVSAICNSCA